MNLRATIVALCCGPLAAASGRPPLTNGIRFDRADPHAMYVATTFGLLISHDDGCSMRWICEDDLGYAGTWDPKYAVGTDGTIFASTYAGLRVSRDGGCTFALATAELPNRARTRIAGKWIDALDLGPTGDLWVATAISGAPNDVYVSHDDGISFAPVGLESPRIFWKSVRVAPSNLARVYVAGYEVAPPTAHLNATDDRGATWHPSPLTGVTYGSTPIVLVAAIAPTDPDAFYLVSLGANRIGDSLFRTTDGGTTFTDVLDAPGPIQDVVLRDSRTVLVTTMQQSGAVKISGTLFRSTDGGRTFAPVPGAPSLACLGVAPDGALIGCGAGAMLRSTDAATWTSIWRFGEVAGPLACPAGTPEHDQCELVQWPHMKRVLGGSDPACAAAEPAAPAPRAPAPRAPARGTAPAGGCCDAGGSPTVGLAALVLAAAFGYSRSRQLG